MQIRNGIVLNGTNNRFEKLDLKIENGCISQFGVFPPDGEDIDAAGLYVIPGFIDTHIHGSVGVEFAAANEDFSKARKWLASEGVTSFAATVRALPPEKVIAAEKNIVRESRRKNIGAKVAGIHLEGPFVSREFRGAMNPPECEARPETVAAFAEAGEGMLSIMTMAPERENSLAVIREAVKSGVRISLGHTGATYEQCELAVNAGASRVTHIFNAMRPFSHRGTGIIGAALGDDRLHCEMICDFVHLDPSAVNLVYRIKGENNITLISDSGFMSGLGDGVFNVDGRDRFVKDGVCRTAEGRIAGSCVSVHAGAKNLLSLGVPLEKVSVMASLNPAEALGIAKETGSIICGRKADIIICDGDLNIREVLVEGVRQA